MTYKVVFENGIMVDEIELPKRNQFPIGKKVWKAALNSIEYDKTKVIQGKVYEVIDNKDSTGLRCLGKYKTRRKLK